MMNRISPVVKQLLIINVAVYVLAVYVMPQFEYMLALYYPGSENFMPFQFISSMFMHGSNMHIMFNMMSLFFLGPMVESQMGAKKFLFFYLICGLAANLAHVGMAYFGIINPHPVVGASGAIMGVFVAFAYYFPNVKLMLLFPPIPVKAKYMIVGLMAFDLFSGVSGFNTGIAHFAHLGGAIMGIILLLYWRKFDQSYRIN